MTFGAVACRATSVASPATRTRAHVKAISHTKTSKPTRPISPPALCTEFHPSPRRDRTPTLDSASDVHRIARRRPQTEHRPTSRFGLKGEARDYLAILGDRCIPGDSRCTSGDSDTCRPSAAHSSFRPERRSTRLPHCFVGRCIPGDSHCTSGNSGTLSNPDRIPPPRLRQLRHPRRILAPRKRRGAGCASCEVLQKIRINAKPCGSALQQAKQSPHPEIAKTGETRTPGETNAQK